MNKICKDIWFMHCIVSLSDDIKRDILEISNCVMFGMSMKKYWEETPKPKFFRLSPKHKMAIARFAIEWWWKKIEYGKREKWIKVAEVWFSKAHKNLTYRDIVVAKIQTETMRELSERLGVSYNVVYSTISGKLKAIEGIPELADLFKFRNWWIGNVEKRRRKNIDEEMEDQKDKPKPYGEDRLIEDTMPQYDIFLNDSKLTQEFYDWLEKLDEDERRQYPKFEYNDLIEWANKNR